MAHQIDFSTGRAAMAYVGATPWHSLGERLQPGAEIETWLRAAGMDWRVLRSKVRFATSCNPETLTVWDKQHVLFRSDTRAPLGVVSSRYQIVQPKEVLEFFRDLVADAGFELETAGCLFDGRRFWGLARVTSDESMVDANDKVGGFLLLSTSADGTLATSARFTTVRVVCNNTLSVAIGTANGRKQRRDDGVYTLPHSAAFDAKTAHTALGLRKPDEVKSGFADAMAQLRKLATVRVDAAAMADATLRLFDHDPQNMTPSEIEKAAKGRVISEIGEMAVSGRGLIGADLRGGHGTAWGWLNAVTQYVDHKARSKTQDLRIDSAWFGRGDALKRRAHMIAQKMADGSIEFLEQDAPADGNPAGGSLLDEVIAATPVPDMA